MRLCILVSVVCVLTAFGSTPPKPGFDPQAVVRQVQAGRDMPGLQPGDHGRIRGRPASRFPEFSELGVEQFPDNGEFLLDTSSVLVAAPGNQTDPAIAFDGTNFLVVWEDCRRGSYSDICGTRVTPQGTLLDPSGFVISQAPYDQRYPALAFDGTNFLVVWDDYRRGHAYDIYGTRVTTGGAVLDAFGIIISDAMNDQQCPAVAFDGANFLVVWQDNVYDVQQQDISGARVTQGGVVLDPDGIAIAQAPNGQWYPAVGFGGTNFFVVWHDCRDSGTAYIYATLVTPQGIVVVPDGFRISLAPGSQVLPALGFDGTNFLVTWLDIQGSFPPSLSIYGTRVTSGGTVLDPDGFAISGAGGAPAAGFDGANFLVVWQAAGMLNSDICGARVTPGGTVLDPGGVLISGAPDSQLSPALAFDGANFLVVWQDDRGGGGYYTDVYGARVTPEGTVVDPQGFIITQAARDQLTPALAFDGANFLVVWEDNRGGDPGIYGTRVTPGGTVLDPAGIAIGEATNWQYSPAIGFDGANFLVVWQDDRGGDYWDICGARVTPEGLVLDPDGIVISQAASLKRSPALGFDGANFLVVWQDNRGGDYYDIYGARVTPGGTVLDPNGFVVTQAARDQFAPALGFDGANFLVIWEDYRGGGYPDVYGTRVTSEGTVLDPGGIVISQSRNGQYGPALGFDGANYLVAWEDGRSSVWHDIYGARVTPGGTVLDPNGFVISRASKDQFAPALAFDGANYLVVWEDYRSSNNPDIYGAWVSPAGVVSDEGSVLRPPGNQTCLALARGSGSLLFMAFQGWAGIVGGKTYNTDRIWGQMNPTPGGGIEETMNDERVAMNVGPTIIRGVLVLNAVDSRQNAVYRAELVDAAGRKVMDLRPGANDVRALAPGVYFVCEKPQAVSPKPQAVRKVVVTR